MVLADALVYAKRYDPKAVIDLATLTGACVVALGYYATGLFGTDDDLQNRLQEAGETSGERLWPFPLWEPYHEEMKSDYADLKNASGRWGGAVTAAAEGEAEPDGEEVTASIETSGESVPRQPVTADESEEDVEEEAPLATDEPVAEVNTEAVAGGERDA